ncbi:FAD-binding oxidoreductase [bacterium]|nr:FAD-binding oxidoreductase [bacterium]
MAENTGRFQPDWYEEAPKEGSYRSIFKWGDPMGFKHPNERLYQMLKEKIGLSDNDFKKRLKEGHEQVKAEPAKKITSEQLKIIKEIVGADNVAFDDYSRIKYSNGKTTEESIRLRETINGPLTDLVVHPRNKIEVSRIVSFCNKELLPIYVFGGGSSVNLGFQPVKGGVTLVLNTHMNKIIELNEVNQTVRVQPGMMGPDYEAALNNSPELYKTKHRFTGGHFPQSFEYSSVGGWVVTLGSGQQSTYYGDAYDIVLSQEYVTPIGEFMTLEYTATATGPKVNDIMKGSEGCYGILVEQTMKIFRYMPKNQYNFAFVFPNWQAAVDAGREILQGEFGTPSVFRISDAEETDIGLKLYGVEGTILDKLIQLRGFKPSKRCLLIGHTEGEKGFSRHVRKMIKKICRQFGAMSLTGYPVKNWKHGRFKDPYVREDLQDFGIITDTLETSVTWDNLHAIHQGVRKFIKNRPNTVCMTHASHFYPQGTNLYFIFIAKFKDIDEYKTFQAGILDAIQLYGGSLSHHHGVGRMIGLRMESHIGKVQMDILRAIKHHLDPNNILNPGGQLGLDKLENTP